MPFGIINIEEEIEKKRKEDSVFKKAWDESREEYERIGEQIAEAKRKGASWDELMRIGKTPMNYDDPSVSERYVKGGTNK